MTKQGYDEKADALLPWPTKQVPAVATNGKTINENLSKDWIERGRAGKPSRESLHEFNALFAISSDAAPHPFKLEHNTALKEIMIIMATPIWKISGSSVPVLSDLQQSVRTRLAERDAKCFMMRSWNSPSHVFDLWPT